MALSPMASEINTKAGKQVVPSVDLASQYPRREVTSAWHKEVQQELSAFEEHIEQQENVPNLGSEYLERKRMLWLPTKRRLVCVLAASLLVLVALGVYFSTSSSSGDDAGVNEDDEVSEPFVLDIPLNETQLSEVCTPEVSFFGCVNDRDVVQCEGGLFSTDRCNGDAFCRCDSDELFELNGDVCFDNISGRFLQASCISFNLTLLE